jgi:phosphohistidine phosphatase
LLEHAPIPDLIVCSSAARTRQTLQLMLPILELTEDRVAIDDRLYAASAHRIHQIVRETADDCETLMVVAHNPGLDLLLEDLCGPGLERTAKGKLITTAGLADLQFNDCWRNIPDGNCKLMALVRPRTLQNQP